MIPFINVKVFSFNNIIRSFQVIRQTCFRPVTLSSRKLIVTPLNAFSCSVYESPYKPTENMSYSSFLFIYLFTFCDTKNQIISLFLTLLVKIRVISTQKSTFLKRLLHSVSTYFRTIYIT